MKKLPTVINTCGECPYVKPGGYFPNGDIWHASCRFLTEKNGGYEYVIYVGNTIHPNCPLEDAEK